MNKTTIIASALVLSIVSFALGYATKDPVATVTVEKQVIVNPPFEFKVGEKRYCEIYDQIQPCEIVGIKNTGSYAVKYKEKGWFGDPNKIIDVPPQSILK